MHPYVCALIVEVVVSLHPYVCALIVEVVVCNLIISLSWNGQCLHMGLPVPEVCCSEEYRDTHTYVAQISASNYRL